MFKSVFRAGAVWAQTAFLHHQAAMSASEALDGGARGSTQSSAAAALGPAAAFASAAWWLSAVAQNRVDVWGAAMPHADALHAEAHGSAHSDLTL